MRYTVTVTNTDSSGIVYQYGPQEQLYGQMETVHVSTGELPEGQYYVADVTLDVLGIEEDSPDYHISASTPPICK